MPIHAKYKLKKIIKFHWGGEAEGLRGNQENRF